MRTVRTVNDELTEIVREVSAQSDFTLLGEWEWWSLYALWTGRGEGVLRAAERARRAYLEAASDDPEMAA